MAAIPLPVGRDFWLDVSFVRRPGARNLVVAYAAVTVGVDSSGNYNTGCLEVVPHDGSDNPLGVVTVESELVTCGRLTARLDGTLDLLYGYNCDSLRHRYSVDGGWTWSLPTTIYSSALPVMAGWAFAPLVDPYTDPRISIPGVYLAPFYHYHTGLLCVWFQRIAPGLNTDGVLGVGSLGADGVTWSWQFNTGQTGYLTNPPIQYPQVLRDGSVMLHQRAVWIHAIQPDGSYLAQPVSGSVGGNGPHWLDEQTGLAVAMSYLLGDRWGTGRFFRNAALSTTAGTSAAVNNLLPGWATAPESWSKRAAALGVTQAGVWEFIYPTPPDGDLVFVRCDHMPLNESGSTSNINWS